MYILKNQDTVIAQSENAIVYLDKEAGWHCDNVIYIDVERAFTVTETPERMAAEVRAARNQKLKDCDWTQLDDFAGGNKLAWATYRQALRDVPQQPDFPWTVTWPDKPA